MKNTIKYTKNLANFDNSKIPIEQQICLLKASDEIKEKAMIKLKEVKAKSEDSGSKARQYLDGLLKIPFGIYKKEKILDLAHENSICINKISKQLNELNIDYSWNNKKMYTNMELTNIVNEINSTVFDKIYKKNTKKAIDIFTNEKKYKLINNISKVNSILKKIKQKKKNK